MCINYFGNQIDTETKFKISTKTKDLYVDQADLQAIYENGIKGSSYEELKQELQCFTFEEADGALLWFERGYDYTDPDLYVDLGFKDPDEFFCFVRLCLIYSELSSMGRLKD